MHTYFNVNRHINPTNVCVASCKLCPWPKPEAPGAYTMALEGAFRIAGENWSDAVTEFHIVGGLHPDLSFEYYLDLVRGLKQRFPSVHLKGFTAVEIGYFSHITRLSFREVLQRLKDAGLDSLPGGGAEIFAPAVRRVIATTRLAPTYGEGSRPGARNGHAHKRHDALRTYRVGGGPRRPPAAIAQAAGCGARIPKPISPLAFHPANTELGKIGAGTMIDERFYRIWNPCVSSCSLRNCSSVVDAVLRRLDMSVKHRGVGVHAQFVRQCYGTFSHMWAPILWSQITRRTTSDKSSTPQPGSECSPAQFKRSRALRDRKGE